MVYTGLCVPSLLYSLYRPAQNQLGQFAKADFDKKRHWMRGVKKAGAAPIPYSHRCDVPSERAASASTPCAAASALTGMETLAGAKPGPLAVTVMALATAATALLSSPGGTIVVRRPPSRSIWRSRSRCAAGEEASCVTWTMPLASP